MAAASVKGFFQRTGISIKEYFKRMGNDYATVARETVQGCKDRPVKAGMTPLYLSFLLINFRSCFLWARFFNLCISDKSNRAGNV